MILKDCNGNEFVEMIYADEEAAMKRFSPKHRKEYGGLYGLKLQPADLEKIEKSRQDKEEIGKIALLKDIAADEKISEIDREL